MKLDPGIHIVMHSVFLLKPGVTELGVELSFPIKHRSFRKKQYDETGCEEANLEAENPFEVNYFLVVVDISISS